MKYIVASPNTDCIRKVMNAAAERDRRENFLTAGPASFGKLLNMYKNEVIHLVYIRDYRIPADPDFAHLESDIWNQRLDSGFASTYLFEADSVTPADLNDFLDDADRTMCITKNLEVMIRGLVENGVMRGRDGMVESRNEKGEPVLLPVEHVAFYALTHEDSFYKVVTSWLGTVVLDDDGDEPGWSSAFKA